MPFFWHGCAPARLRLLATSPRIAHTVSLLISFCTAVTASLASDRSSYEIIDSGLPSPPPARLLSSIASTVPSCELWPKVAVGPVIDAYSPTVIVADVDAPPPDSFLHPATTTPAAAT